MGESDLYQGGNGTQVKELQIIMAQVNVREAGITGM